MAVINSKANETTHCFTMKNSYHKGSRGRENKCTSTGMHGYISPDWRKVNEMKTVTKDKTHHDHGKHGLGDVERVPPVVVDNRSVVLPHAQRPSAQNLMGVESKDA